MPGERRTSFGELSSAAPWSSALVCGVIAFSANAGYILETFLGPVHRRANSRRATLGGAVRIFPFLSCRTAGSRKSARHSFGFTSLRIPRFRVFFSYDFLALSHPANVLRSPEGRNARACFTAAVLSGALLLAAGQLSSVPLCSLSGVPEDLVVEDAAGAAQLAQTVNCSGGSFEVSWVGNVTLERTIHVSAGTTLNITGSPDGTSAADGAGRTSLFSLDDGGVLHLSDLTLANGRAASGSAGGAILAVDAAVALTRCTLADNEADFGGAILVGRSELVAADVSFERNSAPFEGGALYADQARVSLRECTFSENSARNGGGLLSYGSSLGLEDVRFEGNSATLYGGAIYAAEGTLATLEGLVSFVENNAGLLSSDSFGWYGGAGWYLQESVLAAAGRVEFVGNSAGQGGAAVVRNSTVSFGGHLWIVNNSASGDGGFNAADSNMTLDGSATFQGNTAKGNGAGMVLWSSTVSMNNETVFLGNTAGERRARLAIHAPLLRRAPLCEGYPTTVEEVALFSQFGGVLGVMLNMVRTRTKLFWLMTNILATPKKVATEPPEVPKAVNQKCRPLEPSA